MIYIFVLFMLCCGYYTFTFGISQWKKSNRLGGMGTMIAAVLGTFVPMIVMFAKR